MSASGPTGRSNGLSHASDQRLQQQDEPPMSIASLRSRFESLAAGPDRAGQERKPGPSPSRSAFRVAVGELGTPQAGAEPTRSGPTGVPIGGQASHGTDPGGSSSTSVGALYSTSHQAGPPTQTTSAPIIAVASIPAIAQPADHSSPLVSGDVPPVSTKLVRRPAPARPPRAAAAADTPVVSDSSEDIVPNLSFKSLRDNFSAAPLSSAPLAESSRAGGARARSPPRPPTPSLDRDDPSQSSLEATQSLQGPAFKRASTGGFVSSPRILMANEDMNMDMDDSDNGPMRIEAVSSASPSLLNTPGPNGAGFPAASHAARPPSPKPPELNRSRKPSPRNSPTGTPPLPRQASSSLIQAQPEAMAKAPPQLPVRKSTLPLPENTAAMTPPIPPPPIPGNKPILAPSPNVAPFSLAEVGSPPALPTRSRASAIIRSEAASGPPRLPVRSGTMATPSGGSDRAIPAEIPQPKKPSLLPSLSSSPQRFRDLAAPSPDGYVPPPPPTRSAPVNGDASRNAAPPTRPLASVTSPSPLRESNANKGALDRSNGDGSSDDEVEEESTPLTGICSSAKRMLEDFPDSTQANRRPPRFVPDVRIVGAHSVHSFAASGRHVCTGSHHVRVYDTMMSEHPIFVVEMRDTGLDLRVKEPKITAMCFRPPSCVADEGRYLWCGTKDGHLWELDIKTGMVTDTRSSAHGSAVLHIFRHQKWLLSLDEHGKALVFEVGRVENGAASEDVRHIPQLSRTIRLAEKFNFAKLVCGKLWTSSGPAARSTTSASSKGPTIKVYEPFVEGAMASGKTIFTSEWTGAVTSATILPFRPENVYLGHEGGFVSIWSEDELVCLQVLKISTSDILSLEGVGGRLWAGNRKGQIHVYEIEEKPWVTTNVWTAHPFVLWSLGRDGLRAWDGLRSVDWIDNRMIDRQPEFCAYRDIKVLVCSWNIDSAKPTDLTGSEANAKFLEACLHSVDSPDIIVFGFQEVIPLTDKKLTAKTLLFGGKLKEAGTTADKVSHSYRHWQEKLQHAVRLAHPDTPYVRVYSESLVGLFTCVFIKASEQDMMRDVNVCTVKRGMGNLYGNKGAIVARLVLDDTSICFINVHLAAGQSQKASRNADLSAIMEDKAILPATDELPYIHGGDGSAISDHEVVILNGDLNYRIDQRRENVLSNISAGELAYLLEHDQLRKEMRSNHAFRLRSFKEAEIGFKPTYKYDTGTSEYDSSEKKRVPAWCDRILFSKSSRIESLHYKRYETTVSDHKPVSAGFRVTLKAMDGSRMNAVRKEVMGEWAKREGEILEQMEQAYKRLI